MIDYKLFGLSLPKLKLQNINLDLRMYIYSNSNLVYKNCYVSFHNDIFARMSDHL